MDISNFNQIENAIKKFLKIYKIKTIWHLAANSDIKSGFNNINTDYRNTFLTTYNLIRVAKKYNIENFTL